MFIAGIVKLSECLEALTEVAWEGWRIIIAQAGRIEAELVVLIIREECDLLNTVRSQRDFLVQSHLRVVFEWPHSPPQSGMQARY